MGRNRVKSIVGWIIVLGHLFIGSVVMLAKDSVFDGGQKLSVLLVLAPVFSIYFTSVVKSFLDNARDLSPGDIVNFNSVAISILLPVIQLAAVLYLIVYYPSTIAVDVNTLQNWLAGLEVFLGGTVGLVVDNLFPKSKDT